MESKTPIYNGLVRKHGDPCEMVNDIDRAIARLRLLR